MALSQSTATLYLVIRAKNETQKAFSGLGMAAMQSLAVATAAVGAATGVSVKKAIDFQTEFTRLAAQTGIANQALRDHGKLLQATDYYKQKLLGNTAAIPFDATKQTQALYQIISAGYQGADAMNVLHAAGMKAASGGADLLSTTSSLLTVLNGLKREGQNVNFEQFAAGEQAAVVKGRMQMADLDKIVSRSATSMGSIGVSMRDFMTAVAVSTQVGMQPARVGQGLDAFAQTFTHKPSKAGMNLANAFNIDFSAAALRAKGLPKFISDIYGTLLQHAGGNQDQAMTWMTTLFNNRNAARVAINMARHPKQTASTSNFIGGAMQGKGNLAQKAFDSWGTTTSAKLRLAGTAVSNLAIQYGTKLLPALNMIVAAFNGRVVPALANVVRWMGSSTQIMDHVKKAWHDITVVASGLGQGLKALWKLFGPLVSGMLGLAGAGGKAHKSLLDNDNALRKIGAAVGFILPIFIAYKMTIGPLTGIINGVTAAHRAYTLATAGLREAKIAEKIATVASTGADLVRNGVMIAARGVTLAYRAALVLLKVAYEGGKLAGQALIYIMTAGMDVEARAALATAAHNAQMAIQKGIYIATTPFVLAYESAQSALQLVQDMVTTVGWRQTAMILAQQAAQKLAAAASAVWTGIQWALNAAMDANPIGALILLIAGLVAGVIWAYKNVGWFHDLINKLWTFITTYLLPGFVQLAGYLKGPLTAALNGVRAVVGGLISDFKQAATAIQTLAGYDPRQNKGLAAALTPGGGVKGDMGKFAKTMYKTKDGAFAYNMLVQHQVPQYFVDYLKKHADAMTAYVALMSKEGRGDEARKALGLAVKQNTNAVTAHTNAVQNARGHGAYNQQGGAGNAGHKGGGHKGGGHAPFEMFYDADTKALFKIDQRLLKRMNVAGGWGEWDKLDAATKNFFLSTLSKSDQKGAAQGGSDAAYKAAVAQYNLDLAKFRGEQTFDPKLYAKLQSDIVKAASLDTKGVFDAAVKAQNLDNMMASKQRSDHHKAVIAQNKQHAKEAKAQRTRHTAAVQTQGWNLGQLKDIFKHDMNVKAFGDAAKVLPKLHEALRAWYEANRKPGVSKSAADRMADAEFQATFVDKLTKATSTAAINKIVRGRPTGAFNRSLYGYTLRTMPGAGNTYGNTEVSFGTQSKNATQQIIDALKAQVASLSQQNATLRDLLAAANGTKDATERLASVMSSGQVGGGVHGGHQRMRRVGLAHP